MLGGVSMPDISDLMKMFGDSNSSNFDNNKISQILNMFQNMDNSSSDNTYKNTDEPSKGGSSFEMPDMETMMKIMNIMKAMNTDGNDPNANLLLSLKPYLRDSKKAKVDQYIKMFGMFKAMSMFNDMGGDSK